uniref:Chemosensory protein 7 n=1 Tax=Clostera restitura TaxID=2008422 RepID=A0A385XRA2_9NEOP|nr:chemosensory protein 7 [Clostera restitura]
MNTLLVFCIITVVAVSARPNEQYSDKYDSVDLKQILANKRLLHPYIKCLLDQGKCSPDGKELKSHIKEALENYCAKCTETQQKGTKEVIGHLINNEPGYWQELSKKYDSEGKYVHKYEDELRHIKGSK